MAFDWNGLYNPIYGWKCSVRDPAAIYHNGLFHLYFTVQFEQQRWGMPEGYQIFMMTTPDFRTFSYPKPVTPRGYVSPGNIVYHNGKWLMSITRYPWPTAVSMVESEDLLNWSEPRIVIPTFHGPYWGNDAHGPIDGYIFKWKERLWMLYSDYAKGSRAQHLGLACSSDGVDFENITTDAPLLDSDFYNSNRGIENASIVADGDRLFLFCSVGMPEQHIAVLESDDIMKWPVLDSSAEIGGLQQEWSKYVACAQFVADWRKELGHWAMLYMGTRFKDPYARMMFGMAISDDLKNWTPLPEGITEEEYQERIQAFRDRYLSGELTDGKFTKPE